ncbi:MAG: dihydrolipoamide acetyltransferase family protein [bacterium]|nr:dihydrolipoamide acetyltransferase family protein [bacterium]
MTMATGNLLEFRLPDIGEGVVEGELIRWLVKPGDVVAEDQPMFEVMTDKATVEIPSPRKGTIVATHGKEGEIIKVGDVVVALEMAAGETAPVIHGHGGRTDAPPASPVVSTPVAAPAPAPAQPVMSQPAVVPVSVAAPAVEPLAPVREGRALATPATRKLARDMGLDLQLVPGTGDRGRVTKDDVRHFAERKLVAATRATTTPVAVPVLNAALEERIPLRGMRKKIAEKMVQSKFTAPHFTYMDELEASKLIGLRAELKAQAQAEGVKLTYLPFIMKAVVAALKKYPHLNASLDDASGEIVLKRYYNLGIAVAGEQGLVVPVIKDVDRKGILQLAREVQDAAERARVGRSLPDELRGGTFTLSSIGSVGGLFATPILNHPEVGILAIMKIQERPVVRDGQIVVGHMMNLALSFDHRVVDGSVGADFTNHVIRLLEQPGRLLLEMV